MSVKWNELRKYVDEQAEYWNGRNADRYWQTRRIIGMMNDFDGLPPGQFEPSKFAGLNNDQIEFAKQQSRSVARDVIGRVIMKAFDKAYMEAGIDYDPDLCYEAAGLVIDFYSLVSIDLLAACEELLDADHCDHFEVRLSSGEMDALRKIKAIVATAKAARLVPSHGNPLGDASDKELADLEARTKTRTDFNGGG